MSSIIHPKHYILRLSFVVIIGLAFLPVAYTSNIGTGMANSIASFARTPFGLAPAACTHFIGDHDRVISLKGVDIIARPDGSKIQFPSCARTTGMSQSSQDGSNRIPCWWGWGCGSGWIEYATWCYCGRTPPAIYQSDAYYKVPQAPSSNHNQLIFLFTSLQPNGVSSYPLAQPVLQWGSAADGGGAYWAMNSWMLTSNTNYYYGTLVRANTGDTVQALLYSWPGGCGNGACDWRVQDLVQPENQGTSIQCGNVSGQPACHAAMYDASVVLEAYSISFCSDYPASSTTFYGMAFQDTNLNTIYANWGTTVHGDGCGESITNISSSSVTLNY